MDIISWLTFVGVCSSTSGSINTIPTVSHCNKILWIQIFNFQKGQLYFWQKLLIFKIKTAKSIPPNTGTNPMTEFGEMDIGKCLT